MSIANEAIGLLLSIAGIGAAYASVYQLVDMSVHPVWLMGAALGYVGVGIIIVNTRMTVFKTTIETKKKGSKR